MESQVGHLLLRLHVPAGRERVLRAAAERFTRAVLERFAEYLEARASGRLAFIRRLPIRWLLTEDVFDDARAVERFAADLAAAVQLPEAVLTPDGDDDVVVFAGPVDWRAAHLLARARQTDAGAWCYVNLEGADAPWRYLCAPGRQELAGAVLERLARAGHLITVLAGQPPEEMTALAVALSVPLVYEPEPDGALPGPESEVVRALADFMDTLPTTLAPVARALALHTEARVLAGPSAAAAVVRAVASRVRGMPTAGVEPASVHVVPTDPPARAPVIPPVVGAIEPATVRTRFGGLFYLLAGALELDLAESLWKACPPEGPILAHATAALLGPAGAEDPAPALFGGVAPTEPGPAVTDAQQEEVAAGLTFALARALPRRGLAHLPETALRLAAHPAGRLLVASARDGPFAIYARPVAAPRDVAAGLRAFLRLWPAGAPPVHAAPALAELDDTGRVRPTRVAATAELLLPAADSPAAAALLAQVIGVLCQLFAARAGGPSPAAARGFTDAFLAIPARVNRGPGAMTVTLPMHRLDLAIRRAGLDRDPGWIPWLGRAVRLVFETDLHSGGVKGAD
jgi:hypothetical protein